MKVAIRTTDNLDAETRAEIIRLCVAAHNEPDFERLFDYIPTGGRHFLGYGGLQLVSHAVVTTRWLWIAEARRLKTAYVDAVATLPGREGQGYGSMIMRSLADHVDDYEICCLQSDVPTFYKRLGWEEWRGALGGLGTDGVISTPDQRGIMILRLPQTPAMDLESRLLIEIDGGRIW